MLEFIKKIFKSEQPETKQVTGIELQNLEEWVREKAKPTTEEIKIRTDEILMKIDEELQRTRFNLEVLENAKLQNTNIPFRAKQYMEGNRKSYIKSVTSFAGNLEINNRDYFYLVNFYKEFELMLNDLHNGTLRSYTILQEFFANETSKIAQNIKNFDNFFKGLNSVLKDGRMVAIDNAIEKIGGLKTKAKQKINLDIELKDAGASVMLAKNEKDSLMADIMNFDRGEEHNEFLKLNEERKDKTKSFYEDENRIIQSFSVLERPLRKYSHIAFEHEEIVLDYLKDPIDTLINDKGLKILEILKNLEKLLNENKVQIDDRKKEKALEETKKLNKEFIEQFMKKYLSFKAEIESIDGKIKSSGVSEKLKDYNKKLEDVNIRIDKDSEEYAKLKIDFEKLNESILRLKNDVENSVKNLFGEEVKVVI
ncbi:MAG TPA: hypothetical protein VJJ52_00475 [Candidatus Nanoarchaeia archaeon]|nr:hypothetical protein [Candidatus Nanoarchaeia archaeon]